MNWAEARAEHKRITNELKALDERLREPVKDIMDKAEQMSDEDALTYLTEIADEVPPTFIKMFIYKKIHQLNEKVK